MDTIRGIFGTYKKVLPYGRIKPLSLISGDPNQKQQLNNICNADEFEYYCYALLSRSGFNKIAIHSKCDDIEVDITADKDGQSYAIKCVFSDKPINAEEVNETNGWRKMYSMKRALVMSNYYYSQEAINEASKWGVTLWDRDMLIQTEAKNLE